MAESLGNKNMLKFRGRGSKQLSLVKHRVLNIKNSTVYATLHSILLSLLIVNQESHVTGIFIQKMTQKEEVYH